MNIMKNLLVRLFPSFFHLKNTGKLFEIQMDRISNHIQVALSVLSHFERNVKSNIFSFIMKGSFSFYDKQNQTTK